MALGGRQSDCLPYLKLPAIAVLVGVMVSATVAINAARADLPEPSQVVKQDVTILIPQTVAAHDALQAADDVVQFVPVEESTLPLTLEFRNLLAGVIEPGHLAA